MAFRSGFLEWYSVWSLELEYQDSHSGSGKNLCGTAETFGHVVSLFASWSVSNEKKCMVRAGEEEVRWVMNYCYQITEEVRQNTQQSAPGCSGPFLACDRLPSEPPNEGQPTSGRRVVRKRERTIFFSQSRGGDVLRTEGQLPC